MSGPMLIDNFGNTAPRLDALEERLAVEDLKSRQPVQPRLFPVQEPKRVIPFESISPDAAKVARTTQERNSRTRNKQRIMDRNGLNPEDPPEIQKALEFPEEMQPQRPVERAIYTNARVASASHRAMAVAYDMAMVAIGVGILMGIYYFGGVQFGLAKVDIGTYLGVAACVTLLYKLLWAMSGGDTPGMMAVNLRLVSFDGQRPTREERVMRVAVSVVSFASLTLGLLWCLVDEEQLTWHDHITKTFSSPKTEDDE
jgi:uncharacterized RDD family membrane protein YckC